MATTHLPRRIVELDLENPENLLQEASVVAQQANRRRRLMYVSRMSPIDAAGAEANEDALDLKEPDA